MSTHDNKETVRRLYEVMSRGNLDELDRYVSNDITDHTPAPGQRSGIEGVKELFRQYRSAFSDLRFDLHDQIAEGDKVVSRVTMYGRHTGEFQGIPPTGKDISVLFIDILRLSGGKIVEHWGTQDDLGFLTQLGAIPELGELGRRAA